MPLLIALEYFSTTIFHSFLSAEPVLHLTEEAADLWSHTSFGSCIYPLSIVRFLHRLRPLFSVRCLLCLACLHEGRTIDCVCIHLRGNIGRVNADTHPLRTLPCHLSEVSGGPDHSRIAKVVELYLLKAALLLYKSQRFFSDWSSQCTSLCLWSDFLYFFRGLENARTNLFKPVYPNYSKPFSA